MLGWTVLATVASNIAFGQNEDSAATAAGHPEVPGATIAAEQGPGTLWVNPANLAYDADPRFGAYVDSTPDAPRTHGGVTAGAMGQSIGVTFDNDGFSTDWSVDGAVSVELPQGFALGGAARWHIVSRSPDFVALDLAASWRPTPWLGISGVLQNVGNPDPVGRVQPTSRLGLALRPLPELVVGAEYIAVYQGRGREFERVRGSARVRAQKGLYLRGFAEASPDFEALTAGGALELYFGGAGIGLAARRRIDEGVGGSAWIGTDEADAALFRRKRTVPIVNLTAPPPYQEPVGLLATGGDATWRQTLEALRRAEEGAPYSGLLVTLSGGLGIARQAELRDRIAALEAAGKPVTVFLTGSVDRGAYFAATPASHIVMHPAAVLDLHGLSFELQHFRGLMDTLGVQAQVVRRAEFKSAAENFTNTEPSAEQREQLEALLDTTWAELLAAIETGRELDAADAESSASEGPWLSEEALERGLVDAVLYPDGLEKDLATRMGKIPRYVSLGALGPIDTGWKRSRKVALVYIDGTITTGRSGGGGLLSGKNAGSSTVVRQIDRARRDPAVRALVLRVDSPGGSAFASDEITRAVQRVAQSGKPVVVSMGSVAASGGYYVSAHADWILAHPTTITGSIGVISTKISADVLMDRLGVGITSISRGANAGIDGSFTAWDAGELERSQSLVDGMYTRFKDHVAEGRAMEADAVEEVARGRVWSGQDAMERGLVDGMGGLLEALDEARTRAELPEDAPVVEYPPSAGLMDLVGPLPGLVGVRQGRSGALKALETLDPVLTILAHPEERVWAIEPAVWGVK